MSESKKVKPISFHIDDYTKEHYLPDFGPFSLNLPDGIQIPYNSLSIAKQVGDNEPVSLFVKDKGLPFSDTIAKKIIDDANCKVAKRGTHFVDKETQEENDGVLWDLILKNPDCCIFKPTIYEPICVASNTKTENDIEVLMVFDDGYICPIVKTVKTEGPFGMNFRDFASDILDGLDEMNPAEWFEENFGECPNAERVESEDGPYWKLTVCQPSTGNVTEFEFYEDDKCTLGELRGSISSIRLIRMDVEHI